MDKKLTDEEIFKIIEDFEKLSDETREGQLRLGRGVHKSAYDIPDYPDYVIKAQSGDSHNEMVTNYLNHKKITKDIPSENPMLVTRPDKPSYLIQKKLKTKPISEINMAAKKFLDEATMKGIRYHDLHSGNIGLDELGNAKALDVGDFEYLADQARFGMDDPTPLDKARVTAIMRIAKQNKPRIYRAIPLIGPALAGAAALSSEDASAAIPLLSEAESVGESPEEESIMLAEDKARKEYSQSPARLAKLKALMEK